MASLRHMYLGSFFLEPEDIKSMNLRAIWSFDMGHKGPRLIRPMCIGAVRSCTHMQSINHSGPPPGYSSSYGPGQLFSFCTFHFHYFYFTTISTVVLLSPSLFLIISQFLLLFLLFPSFLCCLLCPSCTTTLLLLSLFTLVYD